jgi:hypothetical protein
MKNRRIKRLCTLFVGLVFSITILYAQENRYYIEYKNLEYITACDMRGVDEPCRFEIVSSDVFLDVLADDGTILWDGFDASKENQAYSIDVMPSYFRLDISHGVSPETVFYQKGSSLNFSINQCSGYEYMECIYAWCSITVDDPAVIENIKFENDNSEMVYSCDAAQRIAITISPYYDNGKGSAILQMQDSNETWQTLQEISSNTTIYITYEQISQFLSIKKPIKLRTVKTLLDNSMSYSTNTKYLYYLPKFEFPSGKILIVEPPACSGGNTILKIPYEGTTNYTLTVKGTNDWSWGENPLIMGCPTEIIGGTTYYLVSTNLAAGNYILNIENKGDATPCPFETTFTVPEIPAFTLSNLTYPPLVGGYNIPESGGTGQISFSVSGSRTQEITVHAGAESFTKTLSSSTVTGGITYYNGTVSIDLPAGEYNIYVENSLSCRSNTSEKVTLIAPTSISFTATVTKQPDCNAANLISGNTSNATITLSNISGGTDNYKYAVDGGSSVDITGAVAILTGLSAGNHTIVVSNSSGTMTSSKTVEVSAPSPITATTSGTAPSLWCLSDGTVTVDASGGTGAFTYNRLNQSYGFSTSNIVTGYSSGTDSVYVQDANNCTCSFPVTISSADQLTVVSRDSIAPTCNSSDGSYTLVLGNVQGTLSVSSAPVSNDNIIISGNSITFTGMSAGNYSCTLQEIINSSTCPLDVSFTVPSKAAININAVVTPVDDKGSSTGSIDVSISGGSTDNYIVFLYDNSGTKLQEHTGSGTFTFSGLSGESTNGGKTYRIEVLDSENCARTLDVKILEPTDALLLQARVTKPVSCYGSSDATVTLSAAGGWEEYQYSADNISWGTSAVFSGLSAGIYTFHVKDKYNVSRSVDVTIQDPRPLSIIRNSLDAVLCQGESTGLLRFRISGGTYPYTLSPAVGTVTTSILAGDTLMTVSGLPAGNYTFTVRDSGNCSATATQETITEPAKLLLTVSGITHTSCELPNGMIRVQTSGGVAPYTCTLAAVDSSYSKTQVLTAADAVSFDDLPGATYRLTLIDGNDCSIQSSLLTVNSSVSPAVKSCIISDVTCFGASNGRVEVTPLPGTNPIQTFTMYNADSSYVQSNATGIFENLHGGNYKIDVYDTTGCKSNFPYPVTVGEASAMSVLMDTILSSTTKDAQEGKIFFRIQGGNSGIKTVRLKNSTGEVVDSLSGISGFPLSFTTYSGDYSIEVIDAGGCRFSTGLLHVGEPDEGLYLIVQEVKDALCKSQTGSIVVEGAGGWGSYRYKRATDDQFSTLNRFENLYPGNYLITVTDKMGAVYSQTITVHEPQDSLYAEVIDYVLPTCGDNGSLSVRLSGGTAPYKLYSGNDTVYCAQAQVVEWRGLNNGSHLLHLIDDNGCRFELETALPNTSLLQVEKFEVNYPDQPGASTGSLKALVKGGIAPYIYRWSALETNTRYPDNSPVLNNIPAGYYHLQVTDAGGCSAEDQVYLIDPGDIRFTIVEIGHETAFQAANGYAVLLSDTELSTYEVVNPHNVVSSYSNTDVTANFAVQNNTVYLQNLESGKWFVSGKNASGQQVVVEFEINPYLEFAFIHPVVTPVTQPGGSNGKIQVEVRGGGGANRFTWTNNANGQLISMDDEYSSTLPDIPAGSYTVQVEDCYGNRLTLVIEVPEPAQALQLSIVEQQNQSCKNDRNGYVILAATGGWGDYQFRQDSETYFNNGSSFSNLATGDHTFYVIDKLGTIAGLLVTITEPEYLRASVASVDSVRCKDAFDGRVIFSITGGTPPYSFKEPAVGIWREGNEAHSLNAGYHTFVFTDSHSCTGLDTLKVYVPEPDSLLFNSIAVTHTTCSEDNGAITVSLQGGTRPYAYRWLDATDRVIGNDSTVNGLKQNGVYRLEVTDSKGCTQYMEQQIEPSTLPQILSVATTDVLCYGETNGTARVTDVLPAQPYAPYTITWSNGDTGEYSNRFPKGQHSVTIRDANGCSTIYYFDIGQPDSLRLRITDFKEPHCFGFSDGYIHTETLGGAGGYTYLWSTGATTANVDSLTKGDYWVRVRDANGCSYEKHWTLNEPDYQSMDLGEDILMCPGNTQVLDGQEYVSYRWFTDKGNLSTERYLRVSEEGHYFLEAKNPDGCSVWGDINVAIGNSALQADLLLASEAAVGDTLVIFELSNMVLDSLRWEYDPTVFERIEIKDEVYNLPYVLQLRCLQTGIYNIDLYAYSGGCYAPATKQVEILEAGEKDPDDLWGSKEPLIQSLTQYPNPSKGLFSVDLELREEAEARFVVFSVASGICMDQRTETGAKKYHLNYNLQHINTGVYVLMVTAGSERRQLKIIIE